MNCIRISQLLMLFTLLVTASFAQDANEVKAEEATAIAKYYFVSQQQMHLSLGISDETNTAIIFQKDDEEAHAFLSTSLTAVLEALKERTKVEVLPVETMKGKVVYSKMGYPLASLKKASKRGSYAQYVTIDIAVVGSKTISTEMATDPFITQQPTRRTTEIEVTLDSLDIEAQEIEATKEFYPEVRVTLKFADAKGKTIAKVEGVYTHNERMGIYTESIGLQLNGARGSLGVSSIESEEADQIPYFTFLDKAIDDLVSKLPQ